MLSQIDLAGTLQSIPWFRELNGDQIGRLAEVAEIHRFSQGESLYSEGEKNDNLYLVLEGKISIENFVPCKGNVRVFLAEPLDIIGWGSLTPIIRQREDSAIAITSSTVLVFRGDDIRNLCDEDRVLGYYIYRRISNVVASRLLGTRLQMLDIISGLRTNNKS